MRKLRWFMLVPTCIASWYVIVALGLISYGAVEEALCPPADMVSGTCVNDRVRAWLNGVVYLFVAVSAVAVVVTAIAVAPTHKKIVAWLTLVAGVLTAFWFALAAQAWGEGIAAASAGLAAAILLVSILGRRRRRMSPSAT